MQKKAFYRGAKVTAIGAISMNKVLALMTMNDSMDGQAFAIFIQHFLCPQLWEGAVVVMDNLPAHKLALIKGGTSAEILSGCAAFLTAADILESSF
ncbi:transposase [Microcoleus sp. AT9b-C3]|uniref:transposase n=1 Tax=Microcoleus sp. AT9b-C3 TaxID=2818629 RepID=UPI002FD2D185